MYTVGHSRIISTGIHLPERRISSKELLQQIDSKKRFDIPHDWLDRVMGISERRVSPSDTKPSDLATLAAEQALAEGGIEPSELDAIIYAGVDRDYLLEPATAHIVQRQLGANHAVCFDVTNACHGFMNGIHLMDALIATGQARRGLVVSGEQGSRYIEKALASLSQTRERAQFEKLVGGLTLGDAGAAMVVGPKLKPDMGFMGFMLRSQGQYADLCTCGKRGAETPLETDMAAIIARGRTMLGDMYDAFMQKLGWAPEDISKFVAHQVGRRALKHHAEYAKVPLRVMPSTLSTLGNLVTANIPLTLHRIGKERSIKVGQKVFIAGVGSGMSASQAGLVWDAA